MDMTRTHLVDSEYKPLKAVLLYKPTPEIGKVVNPEDVLYLRKIDYGIMEREYEQIIKLYRKLEIKVYFIHSNKVDDRDKRHLFNMMFTRDLFFMTSEGAIMSKMKPNVREDEVWCARKAIKNMGAPTMKTIKGKGTFEGADALWVNSKLVIIGVGNRTNKEGFLQIRDRLKLKGISCVAVPAPRETLHLLGAIQFVDAKLALVRRDLISLEIIEFLKVNGINIINIPENGEVREKQAMNIVAIAAKEIIMPADCPKTRKIYRRHGFKIAGEAKISQLINGGGGLACATAILDRKE